MRTCGIADGWAQSAQCSSSRRFSKLQREGSAPRKDKAVAGAAHSPGNGPAHPSLLPSSAGLPKSRCLCCPQAPPALLLEGCIPPAQQRAQLAWVGVGGKRSPPSAQKGAEQLERSKMRNQGAWAQVAVVFVFGSRGGKC